MLITIVTVTASLKSVTPFDMEQLPFMLIMITIVTETASPKSSTILGKGGDPLQRHAYPVVGRQ